VASGSCSASLVSGGLRTGVTPLGLRATQAWNGWRVGLFVLVVVLVVVRVAAAFLVQFWPKPGDDVVFDAGLLGLTRDDEDLLAGPAPGSPADRVGPQAVVRIAVRAVARDVSTHIYPIPQRREVT